MRPLVKVAAFAALATLPAAAWADGGEMRIGLTLDNELAAVVQPRLSRPQREASKEYIFRGGLAVQYGLADWLDVGTGIRATLPADTTARNVDFPPFVGDLTASHYHLMWPLLVGLRKSRGEVSFVLLLEGGIALNHWRQYEMVDQAGRANAITETAPFWVSSWYWRAGPGVEWRASDSFGATLAPYFSHNISDATWRLGVGLSLDFYHGVGPSF